MTDKNLKNPYGSVNLPRAQLKSSFVRNTIGEDLDSVSKHKTGLPMTTLHPPGKTTKFAPRSPGEGLIIHMDQRKGKMVATQTPCTTSTWTSATRKRRTILAAVTPT
ncbi:Hypothetical predicted protein, partial [Pelobates cultripes]